MFAIFTQAQTLYSDHNPAKIDHMERNSTNIITRLRADFPQFNFAPGAAAHWSPDQKTIYFQDDLADLFHELGHATLGHVQFVQDIELLKLERDAWTRGSAIARDYGVTIRENEIESALDDYRDWLYIRSLCPNCGQTGLQSRTTLEYHCLNCDTYWCANDARTCGLKRRKVTRN